MYERQFQLLFDTKTATSMLLIYRTFITDFLEPKILIQLKFLPALMYDTSILGSWLKSEQIGNPCGGET